MRIARNRSRLLLRRLLTVSAVAVLTECGGGDLTLPADAGPATITKLSGDRQSGRAGSRLPDALVVRVADGQGHPLAGATVAFTLMSADVGGSVDPETALTDADGRASTRWVLGSAMGAWAVEARVVGSGSPADLRAQFTAAAGAGAARTLSRVSGDDQSAAVGTALSAPLIVRATDAEGLPVEGVSVIWTAASGSVDPAASTTDGAGIAQTRRVLGSASGNQSATATSAGLEGSPVTFAHTATTDRDGGASPSSPSAARSSVSVAPDRIPAGVGVATITITVRDASGTPLEGETVSLEATGGGNSLTQPLRRTGSDGVTTGALGSSEPGTKTITARVGGSIALEGRPAVEVTAGAAARLVFRVQPRDAKKDERIAPAVTVAVEDAAGNPVTSPGFQVTLDLARSSDERIRLRGDLSRRTEEGVAVFDDLRVDSEAGDLRLRAQADGLSDVESASFEIRDD